MKLHQFIAVAALFALVAAIFAITPDLLTQGHGGFVVAMTAIVPVDPADMKKAVDGMMTAWEEFKKTNDARLAEIEKKGAPDPLLVDKIGKLETSIAAVEGLNQKLTTQENVTKALKEQADAAEGVIAKLEAKMGRPGALSGGGTIEYKKKVNAWGHAVVFAHTHGVANLSPEQQKALADVAAEYKALNVGTDTAGGYLAPIEYVREIIKGVTEASPVRGLVRVRQTASKSIQVPKRTGQFAAQWVSEQGTRSETTGLAYGLEEIPAHEMYALVDISNQMLEDSAFDMEAEIRGESVEQFAVAEGSAAVSGNGVGKPEGYMTHASVGETISGSAATIADADGQANGLITLFHAIKTAYSRNATWTLNRTTLGSVRKLKDAEKNYIWMPGLAQGIPNTILGAPYVEMPDMPNEGAGLYPIAFGDFRRAYILVDRITMEMLRDPYTQATAGNVRFIMRKRLGGQVVLAEAIRKLKCAAA